MIIIKDPEFKLKNDVSPVMTEKSSLELADQDPKRKVSVIRTKASWVG
jgi:hypothetical protein